MRAHLSYDASGDLVYDLSLPHFTPEETEWRHNHFNLAIPEHHFAAERLSMSNVTDGFDVSSYQPSAPDFTVNGRTVAAFKATEGTSYFDPHFNANRSKAHGQALQAIIIYHFARPASHSGGDEARYLLSKIGPRQALEIIALDYETSPWSVQFILDFFHVIATESQYPTEFYSYLGMLSANSTLGIPDTGCGLWPAAYGTREPGSDRWDHKDGWQHTDGSSSVPGNDGPWDCSHWDSQALAARLGIWTPVPTPPPTPPTPKPSSIPALLEVLS